MYGESMKETEKEAATSPQLLTRESVLTPDEMAHALKCSRRKVDAMDLPFFMIGQRVRYIYGQVLDVLAERAKNGVAA